MQASAIFQRTETGRSEIKNKMHGLTQSERLALIVIDGVTSYGELRQKLKGLSEDRFERALTKLLQKALVFEVLLPEAHSVAEEFDPSTIDNFLHQDPLDPVTIMSFDPEEEFDLDMQSESRADPHFQAAGSEPIRAQILAETRHATVPVATRAISPTPDLAAIPPKRPLKIASVDFYVPLESVGNVPFIPPPAPLTNTNPYANQEPNLQSASLEQSVLFVTTPDRKIPWGPILIAVGIILIAVSLGISFIN